MPTHPKTPRKRVLKKAVARTVSKVRTKVAAKSKKKATVANKKPTRAPTRQLERSAPRLSPRSAPRRATRKPSAPNWIGVLAEGSSLLLPSLGLAFIGGMVIFGTLRSTPVAHRLIAEIKPSPVVELSDKATSVVAGPARAQYAGAASIQSTQAALASAPLAVRLEHWSGWLKQNYSALRSGWTQLPPNSDKMAWFPQYLDCTTFVETTIALLRSHDVASIPVHLRRIRYNEALSAIPNFESRNHFPETDWTPNAVRSGILVDRTAGLSRAWGQATPIVASRRIDRASFLRGLASVGHSGSTVQVEVVARQAVLDHLGELPDAAVVNFVRPGWHSRSSIVTHQGFIVQRAGEPWLIHVPNHGRIRELPLKSYLEKNRVFGIQVLELRD